MSIHQLTTLAGTASKPYLLRGNQQVTDQIHYGAAPAAGGSRAGAAPGRSWGRGEMSPSGCLGWDEHPQALGKCLCVIKLFFLSPGKAVGDAGRAPGRSQRRLGLHQLLAPPGVSGGDRLLPSLPGKGHFMHSKVSELERGDSPPKPCLHLRPRIWTKNCPCLRRPGYFF